MTGNLTQLIIDTVGLWSRSHAQRAAARRRAGRLLASVAGFAAGALVGAVAYALEGFWALVPPIVALLALSRS
jgi:uncharacterized membrane protein YoaK (UPF0700 family)